MKQSASENPDAALGVLRSPVGRSFDGFPLRRLMALMRAESTDLWIVIIYSAGVGLLSLVVPVAVQSLVNTVAFGSILQPLVVLTVFVLVALGFSAVMNAFRVYVVELIQRRLFVRVSTDVTQRLLRVKVEAFDRMHGPELVNRFFDVVTVQKSAALLLIEGSSLVMQTLVGMILLAVYHPLLLAFDLILILSMVVIIFGLGRGAIPTAIKESKSKYQMAAWLEELASHLSTFRSASAARYALERADELAMLYVERRRTHFRIVMRQIVGSLFLQAVASAILLGVGGFLVIQRQLTLGQLVAAELIVAVVVGGFSKFGKKFETFYDLSAAIDKLGQLVDLPVEREGGFVGLRVGQPAHVELRGVDFSYGPSIDVIHGVSCTLQPGERVALLGASGSGRSTILDLLTGLRDPSDGAILLDGQDYRDLALASLREQVAIVRGPEVFDGTVYDNISLGRASVDLPVVTEALRKVKLLDDILALPQGLQTKLASQGRPLSASQVARLMLARAIAGRPRLLLLDAAFAKLEDGDAASAVADEIFAADAPWTLLCVSNSSALLERCNRGLRIDNGGLSACSPLDTRFSDNPEFRP